MEGAEDVESSEVSEATRILTSLAQGEVLENVETTKVVRKRKFKNCNVKWLDDEVRVLFLSKKNRNVNLKQAPRSHPIYEEISKDMLMHGYKRSPQEIRRKVDNMYNQYRREKELLEETGAKCSKWKYFEIMKRILELDLTADPLPMPDEESSDMEYRVPKVKVVEKKVVSPSAHIVKLTLIGNNQATSDVDDPNPINTNGLPQVIPIKSPEIKKRKFSSFNILPKPPVSFQVTSETEGEDQVNEHQKRRRKNTPDILEGLLMEFCRANVHNEELDRELKDLLRQSNELCRKQNELLTKLLAK